MSKVVKKHKFDTRLLLLVVLLISIICSAGLHALNRPVCSIITSNSPQQMLQENNEDLINLAQKLGSEESVRACTSARMKLTSGFDGYHPYVIKIDGAQSVRLGQLNCPRRPDSDNSNQLNLGYIKNVFGVKSSSSFYSAEGSKCGGADIDAIVIAKDQNSNENTYMIFTAR